MTVATAQEADAAAAGVRIVAFGTSLTARGTWPHALEKQLKACLSAPVEVVTVAEGGATTNWALENVDRVTAARPNLVLVEFYANDAALSNWISVATSGDQLRRALTEVRASLPAARIIYVVPSPISGLRAWVRPWLEDYIAEHARVSASLVGDFVDLRGEWLAMPDGELRTSIPDGLHPNPEIAAKILSTSLADRIAGVSCQSF